VAAGLLAGKQLFERPPLKYQRLTFRRGSNWNARFAPDGQTIVYGAGIRWTEARRESCLVHPSPAVP